jgi:hypothetical protein
MGAPSVVTSAHNQVVETSFGFKGAALHLGSAAGVPPSSRPRITDFPMRGFHDVFDHGSFLALKAASLALSAVLVLTVSLPVLAVGAAILG